MSILIRPARAGDRSAVIELTRDIWGGEDYLPRVFDEWLVPETGEFYVLELDGEMAGLGRVLLTDEGTAWLQGGRVRPELQGQGLASILFAYQMHVTRRLGCRVARFTTSGDNYPVHHLAAASGFERIAESRVWSIEPGGEFDAVVLGAPQRQPAWEIVQASDWLAATDGLKCDGWMWFPLTPQRFDEWLEAGLVWGWQEQGRLVGVMVASWDGDWNEATCGLVAGSEPAMAALANALRAWAAGRYSRVGAIIPRSLPTVERAFAAAGYGVHDEDIQWLFRKTIKT